MFSSKMPVLILARAFQQSKVCPAAVQARLELGGGLQPLTPGQCHGASRVQSQTLHASHRRENRTRGGRVVCWQIVLARGSVPYKSCKKWQGEIIFNICIIGSHKPSESGMLVFESNVLCENVSLCPLSDVELLGYQASEQCTIVCNFEK